MRLSSLCPHSTSPMPQWRVTKDTKIFACIFVSLAHNRRENLVGKAALVATHRSVSLRKRIIRARREQGTPLGVLYRCTRITAAAAVRRPASECRRQTPPWGTVALSHCTRITAAAVVRRPASKCRRPPWGLFRCTAVRRSRQRQPYRRPRAVAIVPVQQPDLAAMRARNLLRQRQPHAAALRLGRIEGDKQVLRIGNT